LLKINKTNEIALIKGITPNQWIHMVLRIHRRGEEAGVS